MTEETAETTAREDHKTMAVKRAMRWAKDQTNGGGRAGRSSGSRQTVRTLDYVQQFLDREAGAQQTKANGNPGRAPIEELGQTVGERERGGATSRFRGSASPASSPPSLLRPSRNW